MLTHLLSNILRVGLSRPDFALCTVDEATDLFGNELKLQRLFLLRSKTFFQLQTERQPRE